MGIERLQDQVLAEARDWIGTPYIHQASAKGAGADCLGLLRGVWRAVIGEEPVSVPAYSPDWAEAGGREELLAAGFRWLVPVARDSAEVGDVLLFRMRDRAIAKHLGIQSVVGDAARFIHAYAGHGVLESPLSEPWSRKIVARFRFPEGAK